MSLRIEDALRRVLVHLGAITTHGDYTEDDLLRAADAIVNQHGGVWPMQPSPTHPERLTIHEKQERVAEWERVTGRAGKEVMDNALAHAALYTIAQGTPTEEVLIGTIRILVSEVERQTAALTEAARNAPRKYYIEKDGSITIPLGGFKLGEADRVEVISEHCYGPLATLPGARHRFIDGTCANGCGAVATPKRSG